tara:strand:+ start:604 stop:1035 length:432 start_codon:yes stop_codon:yes gene_type:complete
MEFTKTSKFAQTPVRGTVGSAGYDLFSTEDHIIKPLGRGLIKTGISIKIPDGYYGRIAPRSSMSWKKHSDVGAGVIDSDYRGDIGVILFNLSPTDDLIIGFHDKVAQLIITKIETPELIEVSIEEFQSNSTERGAGGFGSTGQ